MTAERSSRSKLDLIDASLWESELTKAENCDLSWEMAWVALSASSHLLSARDTSSNYFACLS